MERRRVDDLAFGFELRRCVGLGAGARTYLYRASPFDDRTCAAAYGALGAELQLGESAMRVETRANVSCHHPADGRGASRTRGDVSFIAGYAHHFR